MPDVLLTSAPHWPDGFRETRSYWTDILTAHNGTEQRRQVRSKARRTLRYTMVEVGTTAASIVRRVVNQAPGNTVLVPMWPMATEVSAVAGAVVTADPTDRGFVVGKQAVLYRRPRTMELGVVSAVGGNNVTLSSTVTGTWGAGAWLVPVVEARLQAQPMVTILGREALKVTVEAVCLSDETPATGATRDRAAVLWAPLGESELPVRNTDYDESFTYPLVAQPVPSYDDVVVLHTATAPRKVEWEQNIMTPAQGALWWAAIDDGIGRLNEWWVPGFTSSLMPTSATVTTGATSLTVEAFGYTANLFPEERHRHIFAFRHRGTITRHRITAAVDNGNGTETLTITPGLSWPVIAADGGTFGWLWYGRLDDDDVAIEWMAPGIGTAKAVLRELPQETPTSP